MPRRESIRSEYIRLQETLSYKFCSKQLNKAKYDCLREKAEAIREYKNRLSRHICSNIQQYLDSSSFDIIKEFGRRHNSIYQSNLVRVNEYQKAAADVLDAYQRKFDQLKLRLRFLVQQDIKISRYKRKTGDHQAGDIKSFEVYLGYKNESRELSYVLAYLAKYWTGKQDIAKVIRNKLDTVEVADKRKFFEAVLAKLDKFGERRLLDLAELKLSNLLRRYGHPIEFKTLTYRSALQSKDPLIQNNKGFSNGYIVIPSIHGKCSRKLVIPTDFSLNYHGHLNSFKSKEYTVIFRDDEVEIATTKPKKRKYLTNGEDFVGADVNVKHNLFATSTGDVLDVDRDLLRQYLQFLKKLDKKKKTKGEERQLKLWQTRFQSELKRKCSQLVDIAIEKGKNHLVLEDLGSFGKSWIRSLELEGFKYSRIVKMLNLSSLKHIAASICQKKGLQFSTVPSYYTSQLCNCCGHIDRENRQSQEQFKCVNCGYEANADFNAAINIHLLGFVTLTERFSVSRSRNKKPSKRSSSKVKTTFNREKVKSHLEGVIISSAVQQERKKILERLGRLVNS